MIKAQYTDRSVVIDILSDSFDTNKSVNYIVKQDEKRRIRIRNLIGYSFDVCYLFGEIYLSEDKNGCALILLPDKKKVTFKSVLLDIKLIFSGIGLARIATILERETQIKKYHPKTPIYYLWFIGVKTNAQRKGIGSTLLKEIIKESILNKRDIYLETSTLENIPWYQKFGCELFQELDLTYKLFILKRRSLN